MKEFWDYIYGKKSHMNLAGKLILGVPMFPVLLVLVGAYCLLNFFFSKKANHD